MQALLALSLVSISLSRFVGRLGQLAEAVDHLGGEALDLVLVLELVQAAVQAHAQVEIGDIIVGDHDRGIDGDLRREVAGLASRRPDLAALASRIASSSIDW